MKKIVTVILLASLTIMMTSYSFFFAKDEKAAKTENFYQKSLHATNRGIEFIYSKEGGGLEKLTGKTAREVGCLKSKCHATTCDVCHLVETDGKKSYSTDTSRLHNSCIKCHGDLAKDNPDVHFMKGMKCMNCHTSKEIHGDGTQHNTYLEPGYFDVKCEKCHKSIEKTKSHTVHGNKLDCRTCHSDETETCLNCHVDTRIKTGKDVQIPLNNMTFLINHDGKVTLGNMLSYVYRNKTMITFAKSYSHSIKKQGRKCKECHNSKIIQAISANNFKMVWWQNDSLKNVNGVIPVLEGYDWNLVYLNYENGKWIPIKNAINPLLNYSGYCSPITRAQFEKLRQSP